MRARVLACVCARVRLSVEGRVCEAVARVGDVGDDWANLPALLLMPLTLKVPYY